MPNVIEMFFQASTVAGVASLDIAAAAGPRLQRELRFDWSDQAQHIVHALRFFSGLGGEWRPALVAAVGGASSGKSTAFNNLLGGRIASLVTARGHATRGPILAVHRGRVAWLERFLRDDAPAGRLLPALAPCESGLDDGVAGAPGILTIVKHEIASLEDTLLLDTPDLTSEASRLEGDLALNLLPWFDCLMVFVDSERWFDRQSIDHVHAQSARFGQARLAVFNRSRASPLDPADQTALHQQAQRLGASGVVTIDYHPGRGCPVLAPHELERLLAFAGAPPPDRTDCLRSALRPAIDRVLSQNEARATRLVQLRAQMARAAERSVPSLWDCLTVLMAPQERDQLALIARVFRIRQWRAWLDQTTTRIGQAIGRFPLLGALAAPRRAEPATAATTPTRSQIGLEHFRTLCREIGHNLRRTAHDSLFDESAPLELSAAADDRLDDATERRALDALADLDEAFARWNARVAQESMSIHSNIAGALGAGAAGVAVVLVAVHGPLAMLTLPAAKAALGAAMGKLLGAAGAGAVSGRHLHRFVDVIYEKLHGSPEFNAVRDAAEHYRQLIAAFARDFAAQIIAAAERMVLRRDDPLRIALERIGAAAEPHP